jgi:tetratricopeptide (TPR) repeat protein
VRGQSCSRLKTTGVIKVEMKLWGKSKFLENAVSRSFSPRLIGTLRALAGTARHHSKEIIVAFVLAIVAAIAIDWYQHRIRLQTALANLRAMATLYVRDSKGKLIGQGTGFFIRSDGVLATNYHVIKGAADITARLSSGAFYTLRGIRDTDEKADIAVLQFDARETPAVKELGDSDELRVGDAVYTIGSPAGLEGTVASGNISNPSRQVGTRHFIQFTAPISPGSSGGGLFDETGEVVGITAAIFSEPQAQNLNLAVPINDLKGVLAGGTYTLEKETPAYYYSLGNLADNKKQWETAITYYRKAAVIDNNYVDAYMGLAGDYYEKGQYDLEVRNYQAAALLDPDNEQAFYYLGSAYEDTDQFEKAVAAYLRALAIDPNYKEALHDLSIVYLSLGQADKARDLLPRLVALDKGWANELQRLLYQIDQSRTK